MAVGLGMGPNGFVIATGSNEHVHRVLTEMAEKSERNVFMQKQCANARTFMLQNRDFARECHEAYKARQRT